MAVELRPVRVQVQPGLYERIANEAKRLERPMSYVVRIAVDEYFRSRKGGWPKGVKRGPREMVK